MSKIPEVKELKEIYSSNLDFQSQRYENLTKKFKEVFGNNPSFIARAPGRVNLIGEHVDYMGYGVIPMAIDLDTIIAASFTSSDSESSISISNTNEKGFPSKVIQVKDGFVEINKQEHHWTNYVLCGIRGVLENYSIHLKGKIQFLVDGKVPIGAGVSSSAALVCSSLLATVKLFEIKITKEEASSLAAKAERYTGVEGGGMDQAISFMGEPGFAKNVNFDPIRAKSVSIPKGYEFVVSNSNVTSNKKETAEKNYNMRVIECRLGSAILGKKEKISGWEKPKTLKKLQEDMSKSLKEMLKIVEKDLKSEPYTIPEIAKELEISEQEVYQNYFKSSQGGDLKTTGDQFKLFDRVYHVFSESDRVEEFIDSASQNDVEKLGKLMDQSHFSLRDKFEASCKELELLTKICRESGAYGSRLTGAGWGGMTISLVEENKVESFIKNVTEKYYNGNFNPEWIFSSKPSSGATILIL